MRKLRRLILGPPRDVSDPHIFHHVSLAAFLAWVGLGADGLSSSAYGPEEAYKALGAHSHLAILLVAMTALTIAVISIAYSNLIEHFPGGGGGYLVASKMRSRLSTPSATHSSRSSDVNAKPWLGHSYVPS